MLAGMLIFELAERARSGGSGAPESARPSA